MTTEALRALVSWGITTDPRRAVGAVEDGRAAEVLVDDAAEHRLLGPMWAALELGALEVPSSARERARDRLRAALGWCLRVEVTLLEVDERLAAHGIEPIVLKGPALAHLDAPDPSLRTFADLDLLVPAAQLDDAVVALVASGAVRRTPPRRPGYDRRFAKSVTLELDGVEVDLHRLLVDGVHGRRIPTDDLARTAQRFELAGRELRALGPDERLLHTALHLVLGSPRPRLGSVRDLLGALAEPTSDPARVGELARRWGATTVLAVALDELSGIDVELPDPWASWRRETPEDPDGRAVVERQRRTGSGFGPATLDVLRALDGPGERAAYLRALVWPSAAHLRGRGLRRRDLVGRARGAR